MTNVATPIPDRHHAAAAHAAATRTPADYLVRRLLRIPEYRTAPRSDKAVSAFRKSMVISTIRCTLTYLVFPFMLPALGLVTETGLVIGMVIGILAIGCDIFAIRRFFAADHKWRWHFSAVALTVVALLAVLLVQDVVALAT